MREAAMSPKVSVAKSKVKSDHIEVGNDRTDSSSNPNELWSFRAIETSSNAKSGDSMRENGSHREILHQPHRRLPVENLAGIGAFRKTYKLVDESRLDTALCLASNFSEGKCMDKPIANSTSHKSGTDSTGNISRREFGRRASIAAALSLAVPAVLPHSSGASVTAAEPAAPTPHGTHIANAQTTEEKPKLSSAELQEVEAKLANIVRKFGDRLTQEQRTHLRRILSFNERMLASVRAFPLQNGDAPASVLRISRLAEVSTSKTSSRNFANREFSEGKD